MLLSLRRALFSTIPSIREASNERHSTNASNRKCLEIGYSRDIYGADPGSTNLNGGILENKIKYSMHGLCISIANTSIYVFFKSISSTSFVKLYNLTEINTSTRIAELLYQFAICINVYC